MWMNGDSGKQILLVKSAELFLNKSYGQAELAAMISGAIKSTYEPQ